MIELVSDFLFPTPDPPTFYFLKPTWWRLPWRSFHAPPAGLRFHPQNTSRVHPCYHNSPDYHLDLGCHHFLPNLPQQTPNRSLCFLPYSFRLTFNTSQSDPSKAWFRSCHTLSRPCNGSHFFSDKGPSSYDNLLAPTWSGPQSVTSLSQLLVPSSTPPRCGLRARPYTCQSCPSGRPWHWLCPLPGMLSPRKRPHG